MKYLLQAAKVSRSGYYKYLKRNKNKDFELETKIMLLYNKYKGRYGYRRIQVALYKEFSIQINHKTVQRIMKKLDIKAKIRTKRRYFLNNKKIIKPNILNRDFSSLQINNKWVTDVTYLFYGNQRLYLSVIVDLFNREVVSYQLSHFNNNKLVLDTVKKAIKKVNNLESLILHSDQGIQYTSNQYVKLLNDKGIIQSMSRKGNCFDNAVCECFFSHFKSELIYNENFISLDHMISEIKEYMEFYNNERIQLKLKKMAPVEFRNHFIN